MGYRKTLSNKKPRHQKHHKPPRRIYSSFLYPYISISLLHPFIINGFRAYIYLYTIAYIYLYLSIEDEYIFICLPDI